MTLLEVFLTVIAGNFAFYMGVRTYYRIIRSLQENAFQKLVKSGQIKFIPLDQFGAIQEKDEKKSWN